MRHQPLRCRILLRLRGYRLVQFPQRAIQLIEHGQQLLPAMARPWTQPQSLQLDSSLLGEQLLLPAHALAHGQRVQLVAHRIAHPHQLLPVPD